MARTWREWSVTVRSAVIAGGVALGILVGRVVGGCLSERGACTLNNPTIFVYGAATFFGVWALAALAMWGLNRHRQNHPGHETR
jgi:hypothetical protein